MRIHSQDLARGFTVLMIAPIHAMMLYSKPEVHETLLGKLFQFIAEGPGAQLFMTLMGIFFKPTRHIYKRVFLLLIIAYILNIVKFILPYRLLPQAFRSFLPGNLMDIFLIGDIMHFAALALIILFLVTYLTKDPHNG